MNNTKQSNRASKVKLRLRSGRWVCSLWGYEGYGDTPILAYTSWIVITERI